MQNCVSEKQFQGGFEMHFFKVTFEVDWWLKIQGLKAELALEQCMDSGCWPPTQWKYNFRFSKTELRSALRILGFDQPQMKALFSIWVGNLWRGTWKYVFNPWLVESADANPWVEIAGFIEKKSVYRWTCAVRTCVVQRATNSKSYSTRY